MTNLITDFLKKMTGLNWRNFTPKFRQLRPAKLGSGETWVRRNLGPAKLGSGETWVRRNLGPAKLGSGETWVRRNLGPLRSGEIGSGERSTHNESDESKRISRVKETLT